MACFEKQKVCCLNQNLITQMHSAQKLTEAEVSERNIKT